jgi:dTDP-4-amino-4,6-dideoxygalactose transaminase
MKPFNSFSHDEFGALYDLADGARSGFDPLSGYLAGKERGGKHVCRLEDAWSETFKVKHAIAVNSATSGLLAAAFAVGLKADDKFAVSAMTMSATAAAPMFTGATPVFLDVQDDDFGMYPYFHSPGAIRAFFVTNLFGHPARLGVLRKYCDERGLYLIEDNAQSPFAMENGRFAGTIGHIGVWSLNIHKPIQCGEGGMITTDDDDLARRMRNFINHGENAGDRIGLNLRMPELCAAVAIEQLRRGPEIVAGRVAQAEAILDTIGHIPGLRKPVIREGCTHSFYTIPFLVGGKRAEFCASLRDDGIPIVEGYASGPLYRLPAFKSYATCPVAEGLHDEQLFYFENCAWNPNRMEIANIGIAFKRAAEKWL